MEIKKIKDWVKNKNNQLIPTAKLLGRIVSCKRIKDNRYFHIGTIQTYPLLIKNDKYTIIIRISCIHDDSISVSLSGCMNGLHGEVKGTSIAQKIQINDVETFVTSMFRLIRIKAALLQEIIEL